MNAFPVCVFTKDRTGCACAVAESLVRNLSCSGRGVRFIVCDDRSAPGHVEAVVSAFRRLGAEPSVHLATPERHGLGASMNMGLEDAFSDSDKCLRLEDDWLLQHPLDVGPWVDRMDGLGIGLLRLGMMFRKPHELRQFPEFRWLTRVCSSQYQAFTFNNQVGIVGKAVRDLLGPYPENVEPKVVERYMGNRYNCETGFGSRRPYVAWPTGWETETHYGAKMAFAHIGVSLIGHAKMYRVPERYMHYNDPRLDARLREEALRLEEPVGVRVV